MASEIEDNVEQELESSSSDEHDDLGVDPPVLSMTRWLCSCLFSKSLRVNQAYIGLLILAAMSEIKTENQQHAFERFPMLFSALLS